MTRRNFLLTVLGIGAIAKAFKPKEPEIHTIDICYDAPVYDSGIRTGHVRTYKEVLTREQMQALNSYPIWEFK